MVKESLAATEIETGKAIVHRLLNSDFRLEAALWWWDDRDWRLVLATPIVHEQGRIPAYDQFRTLTKTVPGIESVQERVDLVSPSERPITSFATTFGSVPLNRLLREEFAARAWIEGAYVYLFEPHTFATFEDDPVD